MTQLAIRGNETRGNEVIEILEMLGGKNLYNYYADCDSLCFYMQRDKIIYRDDVNNCEDLLIFTLEEFLEKFPYKVGDKVTLGKFPCEIKGMSWEYDDIIYYVEGTDFSKGVYSKDKDLQPYKEETTEESTNKAIFDANAQCCDIMNQLIKEETMEEELIPRIDFNKYCKDKYLLDLGNYEIKEENGKTYAVRKQPKYPKTYEECVRLLNTYCTMPSRPGYKESLIAKFQELLICRDAYWKIADWRPTKDDDGETFSLFYNRNSDKIDKCDGLYESNAILDFPTEEIRDTFYENFKELINQCKELL